MLAVLTAEVRLSSRSDKTLNGHLPEIVEALETQSCDRFVVDGEVVAFESGRTRFARLQQRMQVSDPQRARAPASKRRRGVHWVEPELVAQIGFTEWTTDGMLRHPRYLGLRDDKDPKDVVRERPQR